MSGRRLTRAERSAIRKAAWAQANRQLQTQFEDAGVSPEAAPELRQRARELRQQARRERDLRARAIADAAIAAAQQSPGPAAATAPAIQRLSAPQRRAAAIEDQVEATWSATRPATRAELSKARRQAWAQLQLDRLSALAAARTSHRGVRRQARSQSYLAAQAARITSGLESSSGITTSASSTRTSSTRKGGTTS